jgi:hypothetical protein
METYKVTLTIYFFLSLLTIPTFSVDSNMDWNMVFVVSAADLESLEKNSWINKYSELALSINVKLKLRKSCSN